jgi:Ca2+-binding RTX toxin-like protein
MAYLRTSGEFLVNSLTSLGQTSSASARLVDGRYVIIWYDQGSNSGDIAGQLFNADGSKSGTEFKINVITAGTQNLTEVIATPDGGFRVVYQSPNAPGDNDGFGIVTRSFDAAGNGGAETRVNGFTLAGQESPEIALLGDGRYVVVWEDQAGAANSNIVYRVFAADGTPEGPDTIALTTNSNGAQVEPNVEKLEGGGFVITWTDQETRPDDNSQFAVRGQIFGADGTASGPQFLINETKDNVQRRTDVAALPDGGFLVVFQDGSQSGGDTSGSAVRLQRFNAAGQKTGDELLANSITSGSQSQPVIAWLGDGRYVVAWQDDSGLLLADNSNSAVVAQVYTLDGTRQGGPFVVNTIANEAQGGVSITAPGDGTALFSWSDSSQSPDDSSGSAIRAQFFDFKSYDIPNALAARGSAYKGGTLNDVIGGGGAGDRLSGDAGDDRIDGEGGDDEINGDAGNDELIGGAGKDSINGGDGNDTLDGGEDRDQLRGDAGDDTLRGGAEFDELFGLDGNDRLEGGDGSDFLYAGTGNNSIDGGAGGDILFIEANIADVTINAADGTLRIVGADFANTLSNVEFIQFADKGVSATEITPKSIIGTRKADKKLDGTKNGEFIDGRSGDDRIKAGAGDDIIQGGRGKDRISGGDGNDRIDGGRGADTLSGGGGADSFVFATKLSASAFDTMRDFNVTDDTVLLENAIFKGLAEGALSADAFRTGKKATDADHRIIYDRKAGELLFDVDGSGKKKAVVFAEVAKNLTLTADDFLII